jgi:hypothetical protein
VEYCKKQPYSRLKSFVRQLPVKPTALKPKKISQQLAGISAMPITGQGVKKGVSNGIFS